MNDRSWRRSATPASSTPSWTAGGPSTTPSGCTPRSATSPRETSTGAGAMRSARPAATGSTPHARPASLTVEAQPPRRTSDRAPSLAGYIRPRLVHYCNSDTPQSVVRRPSAKRRDNGLLSGTSGRGPGNGACGRVRLGHVIRYIGPRRVAVKGPRKPDAIHGPGRRSNCGPAPDNPRWTAVPAK